VAFSDYECPYCRRGEEVVEKVLAEYGDKVVYYHRDYPLPFHPNARRAAEAARCAGEQDRYWDYHVMLFTSAQLSDERFAEIAEALGLDRSKFDECLASGQFEPVVDADMEAATEVGVNGTPAFFVNGRMLTGAQPFESFKVVIDSELARKAPTATQ
jgi:protein-disulfide isomerase